MTKYQKLIGGYGAVTASAVLYASYGVWTRLMGGSFAPFYQAWTRSLLAALLLLPFVILGRRWRVRRADWPALGLYFGFGLFTQVPIFYAFNHAPIATVQLIYYSAYLIASFGLARWWLRERLSRVKLAALALGLAGLGLVFGVSVLVFAPLGLGLAMLAGATTSAELVATKKISDKNSPVLLSFYGWIATGMAHLAFSLAIGEHQGVLQVGGLPLLWLIISASVSALAFCLVMAGYRYVDATIGSLIGLSEILFAGLFGWLVFGETVGSGVTLGGALIIGAAVLPDAVKLARRRKVGL
jgi:drug/metabolite transporter (DMT)-like permease